MFRRFLLGRYGMDQLNRALLIFELCLYVLTIFLARSGIASTVCNILLFLLLALVFFRMLSKDFSARQRENMKFLSVWSKVHNWFISLKTKGTRTKTEFQQRKIYKYLICPQCAQRLRVPRGKGKLRVTCTRCGNRFEAKS